jgi:hypothetical protein
MVLMCVDCVLASPRIAQVDLGNKPLPEVVVSHSSYVLKYSLLIGVNEGNGDYKSLISIKVTPCIILHTY